jgi:hypothetical protein
MNVSAKLNEKNSKVVIMNNDVLNIQFYMSLVATAVKVARTGKVMVYCRLRSPAGLHTRRGR